MAAKQSQAHVAQLKPIAAAVGMPWNMDQYVEMSQRMQKSVKETPSTAEGPARPGAVYGQSVSGAEVRDGPLPTSVGEALMQNPYPHDDQPVTPPWRASS